MTTLDRTAGITWADLLEQLVAEHGTLAQVAWKLVEHADKSKTELDVASVERALRRLRTRGQRDGGAWGQRLTRVFGMPKSVEDRVRWLGLYHSPFNDLPVELCLDQLRLWDRPPFNMSRARLWVQLGFATCATRTRRLDDARAHATRASEAIVTLGVEYDTARVELALLTAYLASHSSETPEDVTVERLLIRATGLIGSETISQLDRVCFLARVVDQRAYQLNRRGEYGQALSLYQALHREDLHPFSSYRRDAGLAYGLYKMGRTGEAAALAHRAIEHAGDGGYTRLRAMGLLMLARITGDAGAIDRARAIATRLGDHELLERAAKLD
jgi:hypothetical protein